MIELDNITVLRFRFEDIKRLKPPDEEREEGVDWLHEYVAREYPDKVIIAKPYDHATDYMYFLLSDAYPLIFETLVVDDDGEPLYTKEHVEY